MFHFRTNMYSQKLLMNFSISLDTHLKLIIKFFIFQWNRHIMYFKQILFQFNCTFTWVSSQNNSKNNDLLYINFWDSCYSWKFSLKCFASFSLRKCSKNFQKISLEEFFGFKQTSYASVYFENDKWSDFTNSTFRWIELIFQRIIGFMTQCPSIIN
jgi:hypothetical protein